MHLKLGDGRLAEVHYAANITVGMAGRRGTLTALLLEVAAPALLRKGASEALGGQIDFASAAKTIQNRAAETPKTANEMEHCVLSVLPFG